MSVTFMARIQILEKKLDEYQNRLELEEKRRKILEDWIRLNFNFDVQLEFENTELRSSSSATTASKNNNNNNNNNNKRKRPQLKRESVRKIEQVKIIDMNDSWNDTKIDNHDINSSNHVPTMFDESNAPAGSDTEDEKKSSCHPSTDSTDRRSSGRKRDSIWNYFKKVPNTTCAKGVDVYCTKCGNRISPQAKRMNLHLDKCNGNNRYRNNQYNPQVNNNINYSSNSNNQESTSQTNFNVINVSTPSTTFTTTQDTHSNQIVTEIEHPHPLTTKNSHPYGIHDVVT